MATMVISAPMTMVMATQPTLLGRMELSSGLGTPSPRPIAVAETETIAPAMPQKSTPLEAAARSVLGEMRAARQPVPGYGHPLHKKQDPRAARLLAIATEAGTAGKHVEAAILVERLVPQIWGKPLTMNVSAAIAAVLLDAGYPLLAIKGVPMLARTASLIAHLLEEQQRPIGFVLAHEGAAAIGYDGPCPDGFVPGEE
jgi:citrate synthase